MLADTSLSIGLMAVTVLGCSLVVAFVRAPYLTIGVLLVCLGAECLAVERATLRMQDRKITEQPQGVRRMFSPSYNPPPPQKTIDPPQWAGYTFLSLGALVIFYSATVGNKKKPGA